MGAVKDAVYGICEDLAKEAQRAYPRSIHDWSELAEELFSDFVGGHDGEVAYLLKVLGYHYSARGDEDGKLRVERLASSFAPWLR